MKKLGLAVLVLSILLCACRGADISAPETTSKREVTVETFGTVPSSEPDITISETTEPILQTETVTTTIEEEPEPEFIEEFEFPEEFYERMAALLEKYDLNEDCDGTLECTCAPEYEILDEEGNVVIPRKKSLSIYFYDINSGFEYVLNPGAHYPIASTVKIPFCTLIYERIAAGEVDPETLLTYEERHYFEGTGEIVLGEFGQEYTVRELLNLAITISDNVAYEMLRDVLNWDDFSLYLTENGCTHEQDVSRYKQKICSESAGVYGKILARFLRAGGEYAEMFKEDLLSTRLKMLVSDYPIYRKYGWAGYSFHDIAYVDAPRPYILAVLSNLENEENADLVVFRDISRLIEEYCQAPAEQILS